MKKFIPLFLAVALLAACNKSERDNDTDVTAAEDVSRLSSLESDIFRQLHLVADSLPAVNKIMAGCANVTVSGTFYPKTVTFDFGSVNCTGPDGISRRGIITAVFTGRYKDSLSTITITTNGYYQNNNKVDISKTINNKGINSSGNTWFAETATVTITLTNEKTISYSSSLNREWTGGDTTLGIFADDTFSVTGSASGTGSRGNGFASEITTPLVFNADCRWPLQGIMNVKPANLATRTLDFGGGTCDSKATANINGYVAEITLP